MTKAYALFLMVVAATQMTEASRHIIGQTTPASLRRSTLLDFNTTGQGDLCYLPDNVKGHCVHFYLCVDGLISTDGGDLTDERSLDCEAPKVCCLLKDEVTPKPSPKPSTLVPGTPGTGGPGSECVAADQSAGRCLYPHLCTNDSTITDGSDLLSERASDSCPSWKGAIQICCPEKYWAGKIDETTTPTTTDRESKEVACSTRFSGLGSCVPVYQCLDDDDDGAGVLNVRYDRNEQCVKEELCCPVEKVDRTKTKPDTRWTCGKGEAIDNVHQPSDSNAVKFGQFPWMASVRTRSGPGADNYNVSGGSIIHPSVILTAAHYVVRAIDQDIRVRVGEGDKRNIIDETMPRQEVAVKTILPHPEFNNRNKHNDIALLFLASPLRLALHVNPICLPPSGRQVQPSTDCVATGWGQDKFGKEGKTSDTLKKIILPVVGHEDCQASLRNTRLGPFFKLHPGFMCAGGEHLDTCTQDGGGPLACPLEDDPTRYMVSGIVSWGIGCGENGIPGVYVDPAHYRTWIDSSLAAQGISLDQK